MCRTLRNEFARVLDAVEFATADFATRIGETIRVSIAIEPEDRARLAGTIVAINDGDSWCLLETRCAESNASATDSRPRPSLITSFRCAPAATGHLRTGKALAGRAIPGKRGSSRTKGIGGLIFF